MSYIIPQTHKQVPRHYRPAAKLFWMRHRGASDPQITLEIIPMKFYANGGSKWIKIW